MKPEFVVLDREILVVASITYPPDLWKAHIGIVAGKNHKEEWQRVIDYGTSVNEKLARFLFPGWCEMPYDR